MGGFPYPFVMYLAMMILVGLWQHMFLGDWPFQDIGQPWRGVIETMVNLIVVWFVIHIIFYRILGIGFNFLSQVNLENLAAAGATALPEACGKTLTLEVLTDPNKGLFAERAVVTFVLIGFYSYPFVTILFGKWPIRPSNLTQPQAGFAEIGWCSMLTMFFYTVLIVPFWGMLWEVNFGKAYAHEHPMVGRHRRNPSRALGLWLVGVDDHRSVHDPQRLAHETLDAHQPSATLERHRFLCRQRDSRLPPGLALCGAGPDLDQHGAGRAPSAGRIEGSCPASSGIMPPKLPGFTLIPFLAWHHYFDDMCPMADKDSWGAFWYRTFGVLVLMVINYVLYYLVNFGHWGLGIHHMAGDLAERYIDGESLIWNFWWIIPLLWNEWFFHKWPFYVHDHH